MPEPMQYLDISLHKYLTVDGVTGEGIALHQTAGELTISIQIPEQLCSTEETETNPSQTETEETETEPVQTETQTETKQSETAAPQTNAPGSGSTTGSTTPKTGDTTNVAGYAAVLLISLAAVLLLWMEERRRSAKH